MSNQILVPIFMEFNSQSILYISSDMTEIGTQFDNNVTTFVFERDTIFVDQKLFVTLDDEVNAPVTIELGSRRLLPLSAQFTTKRRLKVSVYFLSESGITTTSNTLTFLLREGEYPVQPEQLPIDDIAYTASQYTNGILSFYNRQGVEAAHYEITSGNTSGNGFSPYIGSNGNWYEYSDTAGEYLDTGVKAQGPQGDMGLEGPQGLQGLRGIQGNDGPQGAQGIQGLKGAKGDPGLVKILGTYASVPELRIAVPNPNQGDVYNIGVAPPYNLYMYDAIRDFWEDQGELTAVKGETGEQGAQGPVGPQGPEGRAGTQITIGANGNWFLDGVDSGHPATIIS